MKRPAIIIISIIMASNLLGMRFVMPQAQVQPGFSQTSISRMDNLSSNPVNYSYVNWRETTQTYIDFLFNTSGTLSTKSGATTLVQPVSWLATAPNVDTYFGETGNRVIAFPSYFGMKNAPNTDTSRGEGIAVIAAVLSGSLVGYDMTNYAPEGSVQAPLDYVKQMVNYYAIHNGEKVVLNNSHSNTGGSWWYELLPSSLFTALASIYLDHPTYDGAYLEDILLNMARQWYTVVVAAGGSSANFSDRKSYSIRNGTFTSGGWSEPDAAAGIAFVLYMAYSHFKQMPGYETDTINFLNGATWCMNFLNNLSYNPFYEVLIYFAPLIAARMNLEQGTNYSITKMINWTLDGSSAVRGGWGMVNQNWNGFNTQGLMGSLTDGDGYAFIMNTFDAALGFFPLLKYSPNYAKSIGKWILNVSDSTKNYYPVNLPSTHQTCYEWSVTNGTGSFVAYEGLRKVNKINSVHSPAGWGDPLDYNWGPLTDFGYGNNHVGLFAPIEATNVNRVLRTDLNALDFFQANEFKSYLYYNPYASFQNIEIELFDDEYLFNVVTGQRVTLTSIGTNRYSFTIGADTAMVNIVLSDNASITFEGGMMLADGKFVGRVQPGLDTNRPLMLAEDNTLLLEANYPDFLQPDRYEVWHTEHKLGQASISDGISIVPITIIHQGSGYLSVDIKAYRGTSLIENRSAKLLLKDPQVTPLLSFQTSNELQSMFQSAYSAWNSGSNSDKGSADNYRASATVVESGVKLKLTSDTWGVAGTSKVTLDFDNTNVVSFRVKEVSHRWTIKVFVPGGDRWGYYIAGETNNTGLVTIDIAQAARQRSSAFNFTGVKGCYLWFIPAGANQAEMVISDLFVYSLPNDLSVEFPPPDETSSSSSSSGEITSSSEETSSSSETTSSSSSLDSSSSSSQSYSESSNTTSSYSSSIDVPVSSREKIISVETAVKIGSVSILNIGTIVAFIILKKKKLI
jgi:hypothetical protein